MLQRLTLPETPERRARANTIFFVLALCLVVFYVLLVGPHSLSWHRGESVYLWVALFIMTLAPPCYTALLWLRRSEILPLDRHMSYVPLIIWYAAFLVVQTIMWSLFQGRPAWGPYGGDKSMANGLVESMLVLTLSGIYLLRFPLSHGHSQESIARMAVLLFTVVAVGAVVVAAAVPPLPE